MSGLVSVIVPVLRIDDWVELPDLVTFDIKAIGFNRIFIFISILSVAVECAGYCVCNGRSQNYVFYERTIVIA